MATAKVPTVSGARYLTQLCEHWAHKLQVELAGDRGVVRLPTAVATMQAAADGLEVTVEVEDRETLERMKRVVSERLDRFALREAPLAFAWSA